MGAFWDRRCAVIASLSEVVGYKSGVALTSPEMADHLVGQASIWEGDLDDYIRVRSDEFAELVATLLFRLGNIPTKDAMFPGVTLAKRYRHDARRLSILKRVVALFNSFLQGTSRAHDETAQSLDLDPFMELVVRTLEDPDAIPIALEYIQSLQDAAHVSPWSEIRRVQWKDTAELAALFGDESLATLYGTFFDQRFIDYLERNFARIDAVNWRKFEGLVSEFFDREGFRVQIGPGRDDEGVDARVWPTEGNTAGPPTMLVQCKRTKEKVGKVVIKALWADIQAEGAKSGLIVTTSSFSPGATRLCTARSYPIGEANRNTLREWIWRMRSPHTGVFLGE